MGKNQKSVVGSKVTASFKTDCGIYISRETRRDLRRYITLHKKICERCRDLNINELFNAPVNRHNKSETLNGLKVKNATCETCSRRFYSNDLYASKLCASCALKYINKRLKEEKVDGLEKIIDNFEVATFG